MSAHAALVCPVTLWTGLQEAKSQHCEHSEAEQKDGKVRGLGRKRGPGSSKDLVCLLGWQSGNFRHRKSKLPTETICEFLKTPQGRSLKTVNKPGLLGSLHLAFSLSPTPKTCPLINPHHLGMFFNKCLCCFILAQTWNPFITYFFNGEAKNSDFARTEIPKEEENTSDGSFCSILSLCDWWNPGLIPHSTPFC